MWFTRVSIANPVFATMMMVALLVLGVFSYQRLNVDQFPDVSFPIVVVATDYPGASPETVEADISRPIEEAVNTVSGIKTVTSRSYEGHVAGHRRVRPGDRPGRGRAGRARQGRAARSRVSATRSRTRASSRFRPDDQPIVSIGDQLGRAAACAS